MCLQCTCRIFMNCVLFTYIFHGIQHHHFNANPWCECKDIVMVDSVFIWIRFFSLSVIFILFGLLVCVSLSVCFVVFLFIASASSSFWSYCKTRILILYNIQTEKWRKEYSLCEGFSLGCIRVHTHAHTPARIFCLLWFKQAYLLNHVVFRIKTECCFSFSGKINIIFRFGWIFGWPSISFHSLKILRIICFVFLAFWISDMLRSQLRNVCSEKRALPCTF